MRSGPLLCAAVLAALSQPASADVHIVPRPASVELNKGEFRLNEDVRIVFEADWPEAKPLAAYLQSVLQPATGFTLPVSPSDKADASGNAIVLTLLRRNAAAEAYKLRVNSDGVRIAASQAAGLFYGIQTLRQLLPPAILSDAVVESVTWNVPCVAIKDQPRFVWRGMLLDVARHFLPMDVLKKCIDTIALHKMNSLQLHLTDDQGWRIEIKKYPKLTEVGAWREETVVGHAAKEPVTYDGKRHGGFYTQGEIRELVAYAQERFVNIVPEIEMPGHAQAAIAAYPELGNTGETLPVHTTWGINDNIFNAEESTILFLQDVLEEVLDLFPSTYIHIGGDEATKTQWKLSPAAQARIKELGLKDEDELQSYFIRRMDTFLTERGRRLVGWDEILEGGLAKGATVMSWRGVKGGIAAAQAGHDVVMAPNTHTYFDYYQGDPALEPLAIGGNLPLERVYGFHPIRSAFSKKEAAHILGVQAQLWTEYIATPDYLEYMAWPRMCALAEIAWTPKDDREYADFSQRLDTHTKRLDAMKVNYRKLD